MSWRDLVRGVFFRVAAEAWVETDSVGRHQWGWRLRNREGLVIKNLNGRHGDRGAAFDAGVRFFRRHSGATATSGDSEAKVRVPAGATSGGERPETGARAARWPVDGTAVIRRRASAASPANSTPAPARNRPRPTSGGLRAPDRSTPANPASANAATTRRAGRDVSSSSTDSCDGSVYGLRAPGV